MRRCRRFSRIGHNVQVLTPMMRQYRKLLPHNQWITVCMKACRAFQITVDELSPQMPPPQRTAGRTSTSSPYEEFRDMPQGLLVMYQMMLCIMHDVLAEQLNPMEVLLFTAPALFEHTHVGQNDQVTEPMHFRRQHAQQCGKPIASDMQETTAGGHRRSLIQVQSRMHQLNGSLALCQHMHMIFNAPTVRAVFAAQFHGPRYHHAQVCTTATRSVLFTWALMHVAYLIRELLDELYLDTADFVHSPVALKIRFCVEPMAVHLVTALVIS